MKERQRNVYVLLPLTRPLLGTLPTIQARALTGDLTGDLVVLRPACSPLSHTSQGSSVLPFSVQLSCCTSEKYSLNPSG